MTEAVEWAGPVGDAWADEWRRTDRSFADLASHLDAAILTRAPDTGTAVDIGCGAGATSLALATACPALTVTGIDLSPALIAVAQQRAATAGLNNVRFIAVPVEAAVAGSAPVDLFCSRHGVMFFADPVAGLATLHAAAAPGATLVFSCFRAPADNPWADEVAGAIRGGAPPPRPTGYAPGPFAFADPAFATATLRAAGWRPEPPAPVDFIYRAGGGATPIEDALSFFTRIGPAAPQLRAAAPDQREVMLARLRLVVAARATANAVDFPAAAWLFTARA